MDDVITITKSFVPTEEVKKVFDYLTGTFGFRNPNNPKKPTPEINTLTPEWLAYINGIAEPKKTQAPFIDKSLLLVMGLGAVFLLVRK